MGGMGGMISAGVNAAMGIGNAIGSAANAKKAERLAVKAGNVQEAAARQQLALSVNPMANAATQGVVNAMERNVEGQQAQNAAQNAVMGATDEMKLAQNQNLNKSMSDVYANLAQGALSNYGAALGGVANARADSYNKQGDIRMKQSDSQGKAANNAFVAAGNSLGSGIEGLVKGAANNQKGTNSLSVTDARSRIQG